MKKKEKKKWKKEKQPFIHVYTVTFRGCARVCVPRLAPRGVQRGRWSGWWSRIGLELRAGLAWDDFRERRRWRWRFLRGCRCERDRGVGLERRAQHRGAQASRLGCIPAIQSTATATTRRTSPICSGHGVQFRLLRPSEFRF